MNDMMLRDKYQPRFLTMAGKRSIAYPSRPSYVRESLCYRVLENLLDWSRINWSIQMTMHERTRRVQGVIDVVRRHVYDGIPWDHA